MEVLNIIEELRQRLHQAALEYGIGHPDVLALSQELDRVLNEYNRLAAGNAASRMIRKNRRCRR